MAKFIMGLLFGIIIGVGAFLFMEKRRESAPPPAREHAMASAQDMGKFLDGKLDALELHADRIQKELAETGRIVRRKASALGERVADATADARITAGIKAKLAAHPDLSALAISVSTTDGVVTLSGKVASADLVGQAILLALESDGVREVIAALQVGK